MIFCLTCSGGRLDCGRRLTIGHRFKPLPRRVFCVLAHPMVKTSRQGNFPLGEAMPEEKDMSSYGARNAILSRMGFKSYPAYLRSDLWKSIRGRYIVGNCLVCRKKKATTLHHTEYSEETLRGGGKSLIRLCRTCHMCLEFSGFGVKSTLEEANAKLKKALNLKLSRRRRYIADKLAMMVESKKLAKKGRQLV